MPVSGRRFILVLCAVQGLAAQGDVTLPALFSNHAVLQKSDHVPIWGKAAPGEPVTVTLDKATASAKAGDDGKWKTQLDLSAEGPGPYNLVVQGTNQVTVSDVVVGEVWICGGQSNMDFVLHNASNAKDEIPASANPMLRHFKVKFNASPVPVDDVQGKWELADPKTTPQWSAVAYFFGKQMQKELGVPVGLLNDCVGGTCVETWTSSEALDTDPDLKAGKDTAQKARHDFDDYATQYAAWQKQYNREDHPAADPATFAAPGVATTDWKTVPLPGNFDAAGLPNGGAIWVRKTFTLPPEMMGHNMDMRLGDIHDFAQVYWNGTKIGERDEAAIDERYILTSSNRLLKDSGVTLAIRVFCPHGGAGLLKGADNHFSVNSIQFTGDWQAKVEYALPPLDDAAAQALPARPALPLNPQNVASYLFNGMINPVIPYAIRGAIWYQGEGNWDQGFQYRTAFPMLINDWRTRWNRGDFPFYFCQIASYNGHDKVPGQNQYSEVREAQTRTLSLPNTGEAILIDIGEDGNIHPADKVDAGERLALIAMAKTYGKKDLPYSGPTYESMTVEGSQIRLKFDHADGGLVAKALPADYAPTFNAPHVPLVRNSPNSELEGFAICGEDHKWHWADAKIDGATVVVSSADVPAPVAVRYAWSNYPYCNLYNGAGLPAGPFRTDDFPMLSLKNRYPNP
jgi:sialate O-acetylesterase